ncbi:MAG: glycoside hydrolase family 13 protein [Actinomycetes bacterium]
MQRTTHWWQEAVVYQVYPRSFADSNGDGIGDIKGIQGRVPHLAELGVDALWLSPHYVSPMLDAGYDVADYRNVDPIFGNLSDFQELIHTLHASGIKLLVDIVPNHTSWEHAWFKEALAHPPVNDPTVAPLTRHSEGPWARYHLLRGRKNGTIEPNEWPSVFGGLTWHEVPDAAGQPSGWWYLHIFDKSQPDVDWTNPEVRSEFLGHLKFWFDMGVDGFRIDVAHGLAKAEGYPDFTTPKPGDPTNHVAYWDQDPVHEIWREWREVAEQYDPPRVFVAEAWVGPAERNALYLRDDELHTGFNFPYLTAAWNGKALHRIIDDSLEGNHLVGAPTTWVLENHDVWRAATRYAPLATGEEAASLDANLDISKSADWSAPRDLVIGVKRARAGIMTMLALPGTAYIYQGQELGLEEVFDIPDAMRQDPAFANTGGENLGRDGCRVPLPWDNDSATFGFNSDSESWLPQPKRWADKTAAAQNDVASSTLNLVRNALKLRRSLAALGGITSDAQDLVWDETPDDIVSFVRPARLDGSAVRIVMNMGKTAYELPAGEVLLLSDSDAVVAGSLAPHSAAWLKA